MTRKTFFEKFEQFADAPNAVAKMRELILDLAFTLGLLPDSKPVEGWQLRSLESLTTKIGSGATPSGGKNNYKQSGVPLIRSMNVHFHGFVSKGLAYLDDEQASKLANVVVQESDVLLNITGASIGRVTTAPPEMNGARVNQHVAIIRTTKEIDAHYLSKFLASPLVQRFIDEIQVGATRQALTKSKIQNFDIPLPPLAEQKRIVAKVDELMALCDELEAQQRERDTQHTVLSRASLARFAEAPTPQNLNFIFHKSYDIPPADLRKSILTLAVQGKLVPQDPKDEPANKVIARISAEKLSLVQAKKIKSEVQLDPISKEEALFSIPDSWAWLRAGDLCRPVSSGSTPDKSVFHPSEGIPYLKVYNIRNQVVDFDYRSQFIDVNHHEERMKRSKLVPGDVIMNIVGPPLGKVAIVPDTFPEWNCNQAISFFRPIFPEFAPYLYTFLKEGSFLKNIQLIGTAGQDNISVTKCKFIPVPLPPLAEQIRIVSRVEELMVLVDNLERQVEESRTVASNLLLALVAALAGTPQSN